jgi:hypothetical protein
MSLDAVFLESYDQELRMISVVTLTVPKIDRCWKGLGEVSHVTKCIHLSYKPRRHLQVRGKLQLHSN